MAVLRPVGEARQHQQRRVGVTAQPRAFVIYVSRTSRHVASIAWIFQFTDGVFSTWSITRTSTGIFAFSSRSPSCFSIAEETIGTPSSWLASGGVVPFPAVDGSINPSPSHPLDGTSTRNVKSYLPESPVLSTTRACNANVSCCARSEIG